jgi:hypothetical protein
MDYVGTTCTFTKETDYLRSIDRDKTLLGKDALMACESCVRADAKKIFPFPRARPGRNMDPR